MSYFVQLVNQTDGARQDQQRKPIKSKFRGTHLLSGLFNKISEMGKTVKSGNLTLFSGVPGQTEGSHDFGFSRNAKPEPEQLCTEPL